MDRIIAATSSSRRFKPQVNICIMRRHFALPCITYSKNIYQNELFDSSANTSELYSEGDQFIPRLVYIQ
jgi:hypothetical protein